MPPTHTAKQLKALEVLERIKLAKVALWFILVIFSVYSLAFLAAVFFALVDSSIQLILGVMDGLLGSILKGVYSFLYPAPRGKESPTLGPGFRRLGVVLSLIVVVAAVALDVALIWPRATVQVRLRDGRQMAVERHSPHGLLTNRAALQDDSKIELGECRERQDLRTGSFTPMDCAGDIVAVQIIKGPYYRWWTDARITFVAVLLVVLGWVVSYVIAWIVRGFSKASYG